MTRLQLVAVSVARDLLDVIWVGQIPGLNWVLNLPVLYLHYRFAGIRAAFTLLENIPVIETFPGFTAAALAYPDRAEIVATPTKFEIPSSDRKISDPDGK